MGRCQPLSMIRVESDRGLAASSFSIRTRDLCIVHIVHGLHTWAGYLVHLSVLCIRTSEGLDAGTPADYRTRNPNATSRFPIPTCDIYDIICSLIRYTIVILRARFSLGDG